MGAGDRSTKITQGEQLAILAEQSRQMYSVLSEVHSNVCALDDKVQTFYTEYKVELVRVVDAATIANKRVDKMEGEMTTITSNIEKIQEAIRPLITSYKFLFWLGGAIGLLVIGFLWAILTHQVTIVMP